MSCISPQIHIVCGLLTGFVVYTANPGSSLFSWHPTLMSIFAFLALEGIVIFSKTSSPLLRSSQGVRITWHRIIQILAVSCALCGFMVIWYNKYLNSYDHFKSWHGFMGVITVSMLCIQSLAGNIVYYPKLARIVKLSRSKARFYHGISGMLVFTLACVTLILGMFSNWFTSVVTGAIWFLCISCPSVLAVYIIKQITQGYLLNPSNASEDSNFELHQPESNNPEERLKDIVAKT